MNLWSLEQLNQVRVFRISVTARVWCSHKIWTSVPNVRYSVARSIARNLCQALKLLRAMKKWNRILRLQRCTQQFLFIECDTNHTNCEQYSSKVTPCVGASILTSFCATAHFRSRFLWLQDNCLTMSQELSLSKKSRGFGAVLFLCSKCSAHALRSYSRDSTVVVLVHQP